MTGPRVKDPLRKRRKGTGFALLKTLLAGLWLAGVPTYYTVFATRASSDPIEIRIVVFGLWALVGLYVLKRAWSHDRSIEEAMADRRALQRDVRTSATDDVLESLTRSGAMGLPASYEFTLYVYDKEQDSLRPYFPYLDLPAGQEDPRHFPPGRGATGRAWQEGRLFSVRDELVATDDYHLTEAQQQFFRDYRSAAATPIRDDQGRPFGVLTALSREDDGYFERDDGKRKLRNMADTVGVVLTSVPDPDDLIVSDRLPVRGL